MAEWLKQNNRNLLVEAGAGTGKTYNLLQKLINLIAQDHTLRMRELVAITFTEKASAELRTRLRRQLTLESAKIPKREFNPFEQALAEFEQAEISTIHSFCARLLRMRPVEAGVSPNFEVLDSSARDFLFEQTWEDWLMQKSQKDKRFFKILRQREIDLKTLKKSAQALFSRRDLLKKARKEWGWLENQLSIEEAEKEFYKLYDQTREKIKNKKLINLMDSFKNSLQYTDNKEEFFCQFLKKKIKLDKKSPPDEIEVKSRLIKIREQVYVGVIAEIIQHLDEFFQLLEEEKKKRLDFEDLLFKTQDLLRQSQEAREYFKRRFKYILVDEFQDTDPVQVEIVFFLAEEPGEFADDWRRVKLQPGKLFLVGDPKQSLYRFRRADITIYQEAKRIMEQQSPEPQPVLKRNYRSHPGILEWVNYTFEERFNKENQDPGNDFQPRYETLEPSLTKMELDENLNKPIVILELGEAPNKISTDQVREIEAETVADFIEWAWNLPLKVWNKARQEMVPVRFQDFAVLYPTHDSASIIKQVFQNRHLPFRVAYSEDFFQREEIAGLISLLKVLVNPLDNVALITTLRSLFFSVSDAELFQFKLSGGSWNWLEVPPDKISLPSLARAYQFLQELYFQRDQRSIFWLIEKAIEKSQLQKLRSLNERFNQALLNLERLQAIARSLEQNNSFSLADFIDWLEIKGGQESTLPELLARDPEDAITLSTIHKAKGLEFPIVILINLCGKYRIRSNPIIADWKNNKLEINLNGFITPDSEKKEEEKKHKECELLRQFYVATTRAQNYLVLPEFRGLMKEDSKHYISFISKGMPWSEKENSVIQPLLYHWKKSEAKPVLRKKAENKFIVFISQKPGESEIELAKKRFAQAHQEALSRARTYKDIKAPSKEEEEKELMILSKESSFEVAREIGSLVHQVIEIAGRWEEKIGLELAQRMVQEIQMEDRWEEVARLLRNFWHSELRNQMLSFPCYQEVPFLLECPDKIYLGKIDLILREKEGLKLIDFKTDRITQEQLEKQNQKYQTQLQIYAEVLKNLKGEKLLFTEIFYLYPELQVKL